MIKKLYLLGLLLFGVNIVAMNQQPQQYTIPQASQYIDIIVEQANMRGLNWRLIFFIINATPGFDVNLYETPDEETLLEYALEEPNPAVVQALLEIYGARPRKEDVRIAEEYQNDEEYEEMIQMVRQYYNRYAGQVEKSKQERSER